MFHHKPIPIFHMKLALLAHVFVIECRGGGQWPDYKASSKAVDEEDDVADEEDPETPEWEIS